MLKVPESSELTSFDIRDYKVPPVEKYTDKRGYMYIVFDSLFPDYIKVGRTFDCNKRLIGYNSDKPYPTAKMLFISKLFDDVNDVERRVLSYMYDHTPPTTLSREWFDITYKQMIIDIVEKAEKDVSLLV